MMGEHGALEIARLRGEGVEHGFAKEALGRVIKCNGGAAGGDDGGLGGVEGELNGGGTGFDSLRGVLRVV